MAENRPLKIYSYPNSMILEYNQVRGLTDAKITTVSKLQEADYFLVLNRALNYRLCNFLRSQRVALKVITPDDIWVLSLVDNHQ